MYLQNTTFFDQVRFGSQSGASSAINWGALALVVLALLIFGYIYNRIVNELHRRGLNDGYVWLEVVVGVSVTLAAASFVVGWQVAVVLFLLFAASGLFPALGDIYRYVRARRAESEGL